MFVVAVIIFSVISVGVIVVDVGVWLMMMLLMGFFFVDCFSVSIVGHVVVAVSANTTAFIAVFGGIHTKEDVTQSPRTYHDRCYSNSHRSFNVHSNTNIPSRRLLAVMATVGYKNSGVTGRSIHMRSKCGLEIQGIKTSMTDCRKEKKRRIRQFAHGVAYKSQGRNLANRFGKDLAKGGVETTMGVCCEGGPGDCFSGRRQVVFIVDDAILLHSG